MGILLLISGAKSDLLFTLIKPSMLSKLFYIQIYNVYISTIPRTIFFTPMFSLSPFIFWFEVWFVCPRNVQYLGCVFGNRTFCSNKKHCSLSEVLRHVIQTANCFTFICSFLNAMGLIEMAD